MWIRRIFSVRLKPRCIKEPETLSEKKVTPPPRNREELEATLTEKKFVALLEEKSTRFTTATQEKPEISEKTRLEIETLKEKTTKSLQKEIKPQEAIKEKAQTETLTRKTKIIERKPYKKKLPTEEKKKRRRRSKEVKKPTPPKKKREKDLGVKKPKLTKQPGSYAEIGVVKTKREKGKETPTRVESPFVEVNLDEGKVYLIIPEQKYKTKKTEQDVPQQLIYQLELNGKEQTISAKVNKEEQNIVKVDEKKIELENPLKNFKIVFPKELQGRTYRYKHANEDIYAFIAIGNNRGRMHYLYDESENVNPLPEKDVWILLKEDFELSIEPDVIEERWIWENYQLLCINLKKINELIVRSRQTSQEEKIPCENTFSIEGEELVEDDFRELAPLFTGKTIKIKAPRVNPSGWVVWIQNKLTGYRIIAENWTGAKKLELKLPNDLPCECGEFQIDICEQSKSIPVETLFFRYVPFLQLEYPRGLTIPDPHHGYSTESIKVVLGSNFQEWELKTHEKIEFIGNGYQIEVPPDKDILHFSITKRNKPETEVRFQITIPRVKWKISKQEAWNDKPLQIKRDELIPGSELYLIVCTNSMGSKYDFLAILKSNDQILQERKFSKKGMNYSLFLNEFYETILNNSGRLTLTVGIDDKLWFDTIYFPPDINRLKRILNLLRSIGYQDIPDSDTILEQAYEKAETIIHEKLNNLREVCEYIARESKSVIYKDLLKEAKEDFNQNNLVGVINKYSRIINNFRDEMNEMLKNLYDELEEIKKDNKFVRDFFNKYLKENMVKMGEVCSTQPLQKRDIKVFYENRDKVAENINIIKYKMNEFWISFVSDMKRPGNIQYLVRKWQYFKNRDGNLDSIDEDFDEKYIFEPLRENDEIRRTILKFFIPKSLNELNLNYRLGFIGFSSYRDKELALKDAIRFFDKLLKLKKEIQNEWEMNENGVEPS